MGKVLYIEMIPEEFRQRISECPIAYIPLGTLEWHGEHLPLGADGIQTDGFFELLAERVGGIVLPMLFLGPDLHEETGDGDLYGMDMWNGEKLFGEKIREPGQLVGSAYWVPLDTFKIIMEAILKQLKRAGFKIVVAHGHGPSSRAFRDNIEDWEKKFGLKLVHCIISEDDKMKMGILSDHAAANETSLTMALRPDLVHMERLPRDPDVWPNAISGMDPRIYASREHGEKIKSFQLDRMCGVLKNALEKIQIV